MSSPDETVEETNTVLPHKIDTLARAFDKLNVRAGEIFCWLFIPFALIVTMDVVMRYIFNAPTVWAWDVSRQLLGAVTIFGGGYGLLYGAHVSIDVFTQRFSKKNRIMLNLVTHSFALVTLVVILVYLFQGTLISISILERLPTFFSPPIYPFKVLLTIAVLFFILETVAQILRFWFTFLDLQRMK